jgi:hypothetical protein
MNSLSLLIKPGALSPDSPPLCLPVLLARQLTHGGSVWRLCDGALLYAAPIIEAAALANWDDGYDEGAAVMPAAAALYGSSLHGSESERDEQHSAKGETDAIAASGYEAPAPSNSAASVSAVAEELPTTPAVVLSSSGSGGVGSGHTATPAIGGAAATAAKSGTASANSAAPAAEYKDIYIPESASRVTDHTFDMHFNPLHKPAPGWTEDDGVQEHDDTQYICTEFLKVSQTS